MLSPPRLTNLLSSTRKEDIDDVLPFDSFSRRSNPTTPTPIDLDAENVQDATSKVKEVSPTTRLLQQQAEERRHRNKSKRRYKPVLDAEQMEEILKKAEAETMAVKKFYDELDEEDVFEVC